MTRPRVSSADADALVERDTWERVQARLAANPVSAKVNTWLLTQITFCACGGAMYGAMTKYGEKTYKYYACVHSMRRDGLCMARRVKADDLEAAISKELLAFAGHRELTENKVIPGRDFSEDINRTVEQMTHLYKEIQLAALAGEDVTDKQAMLQRAQAKLARLHSLKPVAARVEPVATGQTFRQRWESLDATGRNEFLRGAGVRAVVSRDGMPPLNFTSRPAGQRTMAVIDEKDLHGVIYFGNMDDLLGPGQRPVEHRTEPDVPGWHTWVVWRDGHRRIGLRWSRPSLAVRDQATGPTRAYEL